MSWSGVTGCAFAPNDTAGCVCLGRQPLGLVDCTGPSRSYNSSMGWSRRDLHLHDKPVALAEIRLHGVRQLLVYCGNADRCRHQPRLDADRWSDDVTLGELQPRMVCIECGHPRRRCAARLADQSEGLWRSPPVSLSTEFTNLPPIGSRPTNGNQSAGSSIAGASHATRALRYSCIPLPLDSDGRPDVCSAMP